MKYLTAAFLSVYLLGTLFVHAQTIPSQRVSVNPIDGVSGTPITISTLVFNNTTTDATVTVVFRIDTTDIDTKNIVVPKETAKPVDISWTVPSSPSTVTVVSTKAVNTSGKDIPALVGTIGTVVVGSVQHTGVAATAKNILNTILGFTEPIRLKYKTYFTELRDTTKRTVGVAIGTRVGEKVTDAFLSNVPGAPVEEPQTPPEKKTFDNPIDYVTLFFASGMATLFGNQILFYIILLLIVLVIIRFIFRRTTQTNQ